MLPNDSSSGPFRIGDRVIVYNGDLEFDRGVVDGDRGEVDGEFRYDVAGERRGRHDDVSEVALGLPAEAETP